MSKALVKSTKAMYMFLRCSLDLSISCLSENNIDGASASTVSRLRLYIDQFSKVLESL